VTNIRIKGEIEGSILIIFIFLQKNHAIAGDVDRRLNFMKIQVSFELKNKK